MVGAGRHQPWGGAEYREIFLELGFEEMTTNMWVESSFWCFDSLFVPQQHPARDMQGQGVSRHICFVGW